MASIEQQLSAPYVFGATFQDLAIFHKMFLHWYLQLKTRRCFCGTSWIVCDVNNRIGLYFCRDVEYICTFSQSLLFFRHSLVNPIEMPAQWEKQTQA